MSSRYPSTLPFVHYTSNDNKCTLNLYTLGSKQQYTKSFYQLLDYPMAYFWVQLLAVDSYLVLSVLYIWAISGTRGSSGFGSVKREQIESNTWKRKQRTFPILLKYRTDLTNWMECTYLNTPTHPPKLKPKKEQKKRFQKCKAHLRGSFLS